MPGSGRKLTFGAMYFVYILQSKRDPSHYYVGRCRDLDARLAKHNAGQSGHTAKYRPWHIICSPAFLDRVTLKRLIAGSCNYSSTCGRRDSSILTNTGRSS